MLFPADDADESRSGKKEVERSEFSSLLLRAYRSREDGKVDGDVHDEADEEMTGVSPLAMQALWTILSPSAGYPRLSSTEIIRAIKGMDGSMYDKGGAVDYVAFSKNMMKAVDQLGKLGATAVGEGARNESVATGEGGTRDLDYDSMSKEELLELVKARGMKTTFPKMKRIIVEELRFFDVHGRQGKRHPVKNTLS